MTVNQNGGANSQTKHMHMPNAAHRIKQRIYIYVDIYRVCALFILSALFCLPMDGLFIGFGLHAKSFVEAV